MMTLFSPLTNESLNNVTFAMNFFYEGPFQFETDIALSCEINEVKPEADIIWTIDGEVVDESDSSADEIEGGMFNLLSSLAFTLQRKHLGKQVACR